MTKIICLGIGSVAGGFARYFLAGAVGQNLGTAFPYGTLVVNLLGCFAIGFLSAIAQGRSFFGSPSPEAQMLLMTGFCGAFTTFSTFMHETGTLAKGGAHHHAFLNILLSVAFGFVVYRLGIFLGELI